MPKGLDLSDHLDVSACTKGPIGSRIAKGPLPLLSHNFVFGIASSGTVTKAGPDKQVQGPTWQPPQQAVNGGKPHFQFVVFRLINCFMAFFLAET